MSAPGDVFPDAFVNVVEEHSDNVKTKSNGGSAFPFSGESVGEWKQNENADESPGE